MCPRRVRVRRERDARVRRGRPDAAGPARRAALRPHVRGVPRRRRGRDTRPTRRRRSRTRASSRRPPTSFCGPRSPTAAAGTTMSAWATTRGGPLGTGEIDAVVASLRDWQDRPRAALDERAPAGDAGARRGAVHARVRAVPRRRGHGRPERAHRQPRSPLEREQRVPALRHPRRPARQPHAGLRVGARRSRGSRTSSRCCGAGRLTPRPRRGRRRPARRRSRSVPFPSTRTGRSPSAFARGRR